MLKYKCRYCGEVSTAKKWNDSTRKYYGEDITELGEDEDNEFKYDALFLCPVCDTVTEHEDMIREG